jgi:hypothetical protein
LHRYYLEVAVDAVAEVAVAAQVAMTTLAVPTIHTVDVVAAANSHFDY